MDFSAGSPHQVDTAAVRPAAPASPQLYFAVRPDQLEGHRLLSFEVRLNGKAHLLESVFLESATAEGRAFELLATRPDLRARLARLAGKRGNRLEIRVSVDQQVIRPLSTWQSFVLGAQKLAAAGVKPRQAFSLVLDHTSPGGGVRNLTATGLQADPDCVSQCYATYYFCTLYQCEYECSCFDNLGSCLSGCPIICTEPKSQTSNTVSQNWNGPTGTGNFGCYRPNGGSSGYWYRQIELVKKHTTTTTTTSCDNTTSTSTNVAYTSHYCWERVYNQNCGLADPPLSYPSCGF
jgi:hypothetical protein